MYQGSVITKLCLKFLKIKQIHVIYDRVSKLNVQMLEWCSPLIASNELFEFMYIHTYAYPGFLFLSSFFVRKLTWYTRCYLRIQIPMVC